LSFDLRIIFSLLPGVQNRVVLQCLANSNQLDKIRAMLTSRKKQNIIKEHRLHDTDTGSAPVQIGLLTKRIEQLTAHLKKHPKDYHSRRGLLMMVGKRKRLLDYLAKTNSKAYNKVVRDLGLKK
jgi:small subunit ribosomal protein S15